MSSSNKINMKGGDYMFKNQYITQILECNEKIEGHLKEVRTCKQLKISTFKYLSKNCEHRDVGHCRHKALKWTADIIGCKAFLNGCNIQICPLLEEE